MILRDVQAMIDHMLRVHGRLVKAAKRPLRQPDREEIRRELSNARTIIDRLMSALDRTEPRPGEPLF